MSITSSAPPSVPASPSQNDDVSNADIDIESITRLASTTIVLHPGSSHLKLGRASDPQPILVPHVIAWRHKDPRKQIAFRKSLLTRDPDEYADNFAELRDEGLRATEDAVCAYTSQQACNWQHIAKSNKKLKPKVFLEGCGWNWTDTKQEPEFLIGDDALYIDEEDCYDLYWPVVKGRLNVHDGPHGSLTAVLSDLEVLWSEAIQTFLHIQKTDLANYRCVLLIPDIYIHHHVKELVHLLLNNIGFSSVLLHQESVCATYGCGIATACVVDVGHEKTSVSCIEDGISHRNTRLCLDIGGRDITSVLSYLLKRNCFPYRTFNPDDRMDALLLEELKETYCHMEPDRITPEDQEFHIRRPGQRSLLYPIVLGDETLQAPLTVFFPSVFGLKMDSQHIHFMKVNPGDSEDPLDEHYLFQSRNKQENRSAKREKAETPAQPSAAQSSDITVEKLDEENGDELEDVDQLSQLSNNRPASDTIPAPSCLIGLDQAIVWSIEKCPLSYEDELKRRMYSCILVIGGGLAHFAGADQWLTERIKSSIPSSQMQSLMRSQVEVVVKPKDQDPSIVCWKGGSVLSCLENAQELWITKAEWQKYGLKLLRERSPFIW